MATESVDDFDYPDGDDPAGPNEASDEGISCILLEICWLYIVIRCILYLCYECKTESIIIQNFDRACLCTVIKWQ